MTRLQRVLCLALGVLATAAVVAATTVHLRAEAGRSALDEANRAHARWAAERAREVAARALLRDVSTRQAALRRETAASTRRLLAAIERARTTRRRVVVAPPRVVYRVRTVRMVTAAG